MRKGSSTFCHLAVKSVSGSRHKTITPTRSPRRPSSKLNTSPPTPLHFYHDNGGLYFRLGFVLKQEFFDRSLRNIVLGAPSAALPEAGKHSIPDDILFSIRSSSVVISDICCHEIAASPDQPADPVSIARARLHAVTRQRAKKAPAQLSGGPVPPGGIFRNFYASKVSMNRMRRVAVWARVALPLGARVLSPMPLTSSASTAHVRASAA